MEENEVGEGGRIVYFKGSRRFSVFDLAEYIL